MKQSVPLGPNGTEQSIYDLLQGWAEQTPQGVAISGSRRQELTYEGLYAQTERTVGMLKAWGLRPGDRVAVVLPDGPELAVAFLAIASAATCAPLNPAFGSQEFRFYLSDLEARALLLQADLDSPARAVARELDIPILEMSPASGVAAGIFGLAGEIVSGTVQDRFPERDDVALILHTSGTTSRPKMVPLTHGNLLASARNIQAAYKLTSVDRCLNVMPLFHIHGLVAAILSTVVSGANVFCTPGFDPASFFDWLAVYQPTWYTTVPTMLQEVLNRAEAKRQVIADCPLRFIRSCSAPLPPTLMAELERVFEVPVLEAYGMTEAAHQITSNPLPPQERKQGAVGLPTGPKVAIMDEAGNLLRAGETGEIVIQGANVTQGYENNPQANEAAFVDGWFRTGDLGLFDKDGYLRITGRIKEIINRGGEKVAPREVEEVLLRHPAVAQAVTFSVPHATLGEDIATAVVLVAGSSVTEQELREMALNQLADYKVPSQVVVVDEIPKGATGKLQRIGLADQLMGRLRVEYAAPSSQTEAAVAEIWAGVLGVRQVGVHDNFFRLGGDSLRATQAVSRMSAAFQIELPVTAMFREPTVAGQAVLIEEMLVEEIEALPEEEARRLTQ